MLKKYIEGSLEFSSYEEMREKFSIKIPENFNFAYDIVDEYAGTEPNRTALVWCDDNDEERYFSFFDLAEASAKTANFLKERGIKKGDRVMIILRRRYEFWFFLLALHKIGAIAIPATTMLLAKDVEYRNKAANVKMIVTVDEENLQEEVEKSLENSPSVESLVTIGKKRKGWISFYDFYSLIFIIFLMFLVKISPVSRLNKKK